MTKKLKNEAVKTYGKIFDFAKNCSMKLLFVKAMYFVSGILISRGSVLGSYYPFGISLSASVPGAVITPAVIGTLLGYLFPLRLAVSVRYISTVIAVAAIRWALSDLNKIKKHALYTPSIVFISVFVTGFAINSAEGLDARDVSLSVLEAVVAAVAAYFFDKSFRILSERKNYALNSKEFMCLSLSFSMVSLSLSGLCVGGISIGRILATVMILISSYIMGITGGAISGISCGVIFSLPSFGFTYLSGAYAFGGMVSGFCSSFGRIGVCMAFLCANTLMSFQAGNTVKMVSGFYETIIAIGIFLVLPAAFYKKFKTLSPSFSKICDANALKKSVIQKLRFASASLGSVPECIEKASSEFSSSNKIDSKSVCVAGAYKICGSCGLCGLCWSKNSDDTHRNFDTMTDLILQNRNVTSKDFSSGFLSRCHKTDLLIENSLKSYHDFCVQNTARRQIGEFKKIMTEQMSGISSLIENISDDISHSCTFDETLALNITNELADLGIEVMGTVCKKDGNGKLFIDIECESIISDKFDSKVFERISKICNKKLSEPTMNILGDLCRIQLCEKKVLAVDFGFSQHSFNNGKYCGDSCTKFEDGEGNFNVIISDGMGTGGSAAAQGAMTSSLMKSFVRSGIDFDSSVKFVNSALLLRPGEENLSTLDAFSVNLFTGEAKFMKAGSPLTFVVHDEEITKIDFESLPIGILSNVSFSSQKLKLCEGDWIIMMSDGVTDIGDEWIEEIIKYKKYETAEDLARMIVKNAVLIRCKFHDDDITAAVIKISKRH